MTWRKRAPRWHDERHIWDVLSRLPNAGKRQQRSGRPSVLVRMSGHTHCFLTAGFARQAVAPNLPRVGVVPEFLMPAPGTKKPTPTLSFSLPQSDPIGGAGIVCAMPHLDAACLERAWPIICRLIGLLQVYVPRLTPRAATRGHWQHLTRVAESLVRRWLVLKACQSPWPRVRIGQRGAGSRISALALSGMTDNSPSRGRFFRLTEPEPVMPVLTYHPGATGQPGYYVLGPARGGEAGHLPRRFNPERLCRRCAALQAVIADPGAHTLRMARWLARAAARCKRQAGRRHPFGVGRPPGASRRQRRRDPERQNLLNYLNEMARDAAARYAGT